MAGGAKIGRMAVARKSKVALDDAQVVAFVESMWEHRDELARLATELPTLLHDTGVQMREAGARAQAASTYLAGDVREYAAHAADMLEASKHQLLSVLRALEKAGGMLKNLPFIGEMGKMMGDQLGAIGDVADNLDAVGQKVRGLGDRLGDVGGDLERMGASLLGGGAGLSRFAKGAAGAAAVGTKPAGKQAAGKHAAASKATPKKAGGKKADGKKAATKQAAATKSGAKKAAPAAKKGSGASAATAKAPAAKKSAASKQPATKGARAR